MKGKMVVYPADGGEPTTTEFDRPLHLDDDVKPALDGGWLEVVPHWSLFDGLPAVVLCDEDGKRKGLPINRQATALWWRASPLMQGVDYLVGPIIVVTGDRQFMRSL